MANATPSAPRGIRKLNEWVTQDKRTLIITEEDASKLDWSRIPYGTIKINEATGIMSVKLKGALVTHDGHVLENAHIDSQGRVVRNDGKIFKKIDSPNESYTASDVSYTSETNWVPAGIKNDGTICISRDSYVVTEAFTILEPEVVYEGEICCKYSNSEGEIRYIRKQNGHIVIALEKGEYVLGRNHLEVFLDDVLRRDSNSDGIEELDPRHIILKEDIVPNQEITVKYTQISRIGNPYPRFFLNSKTPERAEEGDFWLDKNFDPMEVGLDGEVLPPLSERIIPWKNLTGTPTTLEGYGIRDVFSREGHLHHWADIVDAPNSMLANGGNADTVSGYRVGVAPNNILKLDENGKLPNSVFNSDVLSAAKILYVQPNDPINPKENSIWMKTTPNGECWKLYRNGVWVTLDDDVAHYSDTPNNGDNSNRIATTAFTHRLLSSELENIKRSLQNDRSSYNGNTGYRIFQDGFCIQWGRSFDTSVHGGGESAEGESSFFSFPMRFKNIPIVVFSAGIDVNDVRYDMWYHLLRKTESGFTVYANGIDRGTRIRLPHIDWIAIGKI